MFPFDLLKNIRKPKVFMMFLGESKGNIRKERVKQIRVVFRILPNIKIELFWEIVRSQMLTES